MADADVVKNTAVSDKAARGPAAGDILDGKAIHDLAVLFPPMAVARTDSGYDADFHRDCFQGRHPD